MSNQKKVEMTKKALNAMMYSKKEDLKKVNTTVKDFAQKLEQKADEVMHTSNTGAGEEYVPEELADTVIDKIRDEEKLMDYFPEPKDMPSNPHPIPLEGADPTWNYVEETTDVPATDNGTSKAGTDELVLNAKKFRTSVPLSSEWQEDSIINVRNLLERKIGDSYAELLDAAVLNGDTTTASTGNVNLDDAAPSGDEYYLAFDGLRKKALDDENDVQAGTLELQDIRNAEQQLDQKGGRPGDLVLAIDHKTHQKLKSLTQVETMDKFGDMATVQNGMIKMIDGIPVVKSDQLSLTDADGKVSSTDANNTQGQAVLAYAPDIITGFRRQLKVIPDYRPKYDDYRIYGYTRFALAIKASDSVAMIRDINL